MSIFQVFAASSPVYSNEYGPRHLYSTIISDDRWFWYISENGKSNASATRYDTELTNFVDKTGRPLKVAFFGQDLTDTNITIGSTGPAGGTLNSINLYDTDGVTLLQTVTFDHPIELSQVHDQYNSPFHSVGQFWSFLRQFAFEGNDVVLGHDGDETLSANGHGDTVFAGGGRDSIYIESSDWMPSLPRGLIDGGAGHDVLAVSLTRWSGSQTLDLRGMETEAGVEFLPGWTVRQVESLYLYLGVGNDSVICGAGNADIDGGAGNDTIIGGVGDDRLDGGTGDDLVIGGAGDDTFQFDTGFYFDWTAFELKLLPAADTIDGGEGNDRLLVNIHDRLSDFQIDLRFAATNSGALQTSGAIFKNIESVWINIGYSQYDNFGSTVYGAIGNDHIFSGSGDDYIDGFDGNDNISGGNGIDFLRGGEGNDTLDGGNGFDTLDGGEGIDTVSYRSAGQGVIVNLADQSAAILDGSGLKAIDSLVDIEAIEGSSFSDVLIGNTGDNDFIGSQGDDAIDGAAGFDSIMFYGYRAAYVVSGFATDFTIYGYGSSTKLMNIEVIIAYSSEGYVGQYTFADLIAGQINGTDGVDALVASAPDTVLIGLAGDDVLSSHQSGSTGLNGGDGNDTLILQGSGNYADGGEGVDIAKFSSDRSSAIVRGDENQAIIVIGDRWHNIKNVEYFEFNGAIYTISDLNSGVMIGSFNADTLHGTVGNDTIDGRGGHDRIFGDVGSDTLIGGVGSDSLDGGEGFDFASYGSASEGVVACLNAPTENCGGALGDIYTSIEGLIGSGFNDYLAGDDLTGNGLVAGSGDDYAAGNGGDDTIWGDAGNDQFWGGEGADELDGGEGYDVARYDYALTRVIARLDGATNSGEAAGDIYVGVEGLYGSAFGDYLIGNSEANVLVGLGGDDVLYGLGGDDILMGNGGIDAFAFNNAAFGTDTVLDFVTTAAGGAAHDYIDFRGIPTLASFSIVQVGADAHVVTNQGTVVLQNINVTTLVAGDFLF
jgi:Ca2+-binding RTX toxin-like protein